MAVAPCAFAGDPLARAVVERGFSVQAGGDFHAQPRTAATHTRNKADIQFLRLAFEQTDGSLKTRVRQGSQASACHQRVGVCHCSHYPCDAALDKGRGAGRGASRVIARFQRDIGRRAACSFSCAAQGVHFRVGLAGAFMPAFTDDYAIAYDNAADSRVRCGRV